MKKIDYSDITKLGDFARLLLDLCKKEDIRIILLQGDLGAGKTTITQSIGNQLGVKTRVNSPTFTIAKKHESKNNIFKHLHHYDLYRLSSTNDLEDIGIYDEISDKKNLIVVEWPEIIIKKLEKYILVKLNTDTGKRIAEVSIVEPHGDHFVLHVVP